MSDKTFKDFDVMIEIVPVGQNSECADYDNPQGLIFGEAVSVRAYNEYGDTKVLFIGVDEGGNMVRKASNLVAGLTARAATGREPVAFDTWKDGRAMFGSKAYLAYGQEDQIAWERSQEGLDPY